MILASLKSPEVRNIGIEGEATEFPGNNRHIIFPDPPFWSLFGNFGAHRIKL